MIRKSEIPEIAICDKCDEPMKVIELSEKAAKLGVQVTKGSYSIECCGFQLTIDDNDAHAELVNILLAYHRGRNMESGKT